MLGFPLTGGFIGKFYVFSAAYDSGLWWLVVAGVIATMISAYYYLGVVRAMYFRESTELQLAPAGGSPPREVVLGGGVVVCLVVTVGSFFAVQPLIDVASSAASAIHSSPTAAAPGRDGPSMLIYPVRDGKDRLVNAHLARPRLVSPRHRRRQPDLRRPVPLRADLPRQREGA